MIALRACKQLMITVRKVKRARQLQGRGCVGIASVAPLLLREELDRHAAPSAAPCATACSLKGFSIGVGCEQARRWAPPARHDRRGAFSKPMLNVWFSLPSHPPGFGKTQGGNGMRIGYARGSTEEQSLAVQLDALRHAGCERLFTEKASAVPSPRRGLSEARSHLRPGDVLVVWQLDPVGRS